MNEELKQKLTERFDVISSKAECDKDVRDALLKAYLAGGEYGYQYAVDKACKWLRENIYHRVYECGDRLGYPTADFLKDFRRAMCNG